MLVLATLGVVLLRRRGLDPGAGVDAYLSSVPVLVAVAAALVAVRLVPWLFLGVARADGVRRWRWVRWRADRRGQHRGVRRGGHLHRRGGRDRAATLTVPADAWLSGYTFSPDAQDALSRVSGVTAVARVWVASNRRLVPEAGSPSRQIGTARVLVVDGPAFAQVVARSGVEVDVPAALRAAARGDGPVPAVVSSQVATQVGDQAAVDVQGRLYEFRVAEVVEAFPGVGLGTERFVVLPWQALPEYEYTPIIPNRYLVAGDDIDEADLLGVADDAQRRRQAAVLGVEVTRTQVPASLQTWRGYREDLDRTGANDVLTLAFTAGAAGAPRWRAGRRVRGGRRRCRARPDAVPVAHPGPVRRPWPALLVYELVPLVLVAALTGAAVGAALPRILGPTLGLSAFVPGVPVRDHLDPLVLASVLGLVVLGLVTGLVVENLMNRRMRLGEVLRLGEENP